MECFEIRDERFRSCVLANAPLEKLGEGFRWLEGPVWFADLECLLVSDLPNDRVLRWTEASGVTHFRSPSGFANGHTRDRQGRLISCLHRERSITRTEYDGTVQTLCNHFESKRLNAPNDVVVKSDDTIWFTDPIYGINTDYEGGKQTPELKPCVYRFDPKDKSLLNVSSNFVGPNGLCFSPDEHKLYIVDSGEQFAPVPSHVIKVCDVSKNGKTLLNFRTFHEPEGGIADGIRCDEKGNIWAAAKDGVHCIDASGKLLGKIRVPSLVANITFGGRNRSRLFICASDTLYAIYLNVRGCHSP